MRGSSAESFVMKRTQRSYLQDELDRCKQRRLALEPRIAEAQAKVDAMTAKRTRI
jgi:hypothetical protein